MKTALLFICVCFTVFISSCSKDDNQITGGDPPSAGESQFTQRKLAVQAAPDKALADTTTSLKVTCYPRFTGAGWMSINIGTTSQIFLTVLEYPYIDTLKENLQILIHTKFQAGIPCNKEWRFKFLYKPYGNYHITMLAAYDSIYVADSAKMYKVDSPEMKRIIWIEPDGIKQDYVLSSVD
jgi:hypothetical protein